MNTQNQYILPVAVVVAGLIIAAAVIWGPHGGSANDVVGPTAPSGAPSAQGAQGAAGAQAPNAKNVNIQGDPFIGKANAPLTIVYWSDYQCPFCKQFDTQTMGQLVTNYVNTGKVRVVFKDFQFLGPDSLSMALIARAVWQLYPDKYFAWREAMYQNQGKEDSNYATPAFLDSIMAMVPGINSTKVDALAVQNKQVFTNQISADKDEGSKFGVNGTPAFIAGNMLLSGAISYATFSGDIDSQLK